MKTYRVNVHYEGCFTYEVTADSEDEAEAIATELFCDESAEAIADNLADSHVCDCYDISPWRP